MSPKTITRETRKPFYAYVGAVDLAVEKTRELPTEFFAKATTLVPKTTALVGDLPTKITGKAAARYADLVVRGEKLVGTIRRAPNTKTAAAQVKSAQAKAKAATTSAAKAVKATAKAVDKAVDEVG